MTAILIFLTALLCVSGLLCVSAKAVLHIDPRIEQWPLFWTTSLILCVLIPVLGQFVMMMPDWVPTPAIDGLSLHEPLQSLALLSGAEPMTETGGRYFAVPHAADALVLIYGLGVVLNLAKLGRGRFQIHRLIAKAGPLSGGFEDNVLVSPKVCSPFAWTPFGRPQHSRIVVPEIYAEQMSRRSLSDILTHERAHINRRDDEWGLILRTILCVCWVSPFAHTLFASWGQSTEIQCDMAVTANRDPDMRKRYAHTLMQAIHIMAGRVRQYPAAAFSTHRIRNEKMRITHIMNGTAPAFKRRRDRVGLAVTASVLTVAGVMGMSPVASADNKPPQLIKVADRAGPTTPTKNPARVISPAAHTIVTGRLTSAFGPAADPFKKGATRNHWGVDIAAPTGTPIYAPANGVIIAATDAYNGNPKYGNVVALQTQGGVLTVFAHLDGYSVAPGQTVIEGTQIATVGNSGKSTGPHVHIETYRNGTRVDPMRVWTITAD